MEFLKDLAIPHSLEHFRLTVLIMALSAVIFVPYVGLTLGSSVLSVWYNRKGRKENNPVFLQFARELMDKVLSSKSLIVFLAVVPGLSLVLSFVQILQGTPSPGVGFAGYGFLFLLAGMSLLYSYRHSFRIHEILGSYQELLALQQGTNVDKEVKAYQAENTASHNRSGIYGTMFLFLAVLFYSAAFSTTAHPLQWDMNVILLFISPDAWVKSIEVLLMSVGITGIGMLFFTFAWEQRKEHSAEYTALARKLGIRLSTIGLLTIPLLVLFHIASISDSALSGSVYSLAGTAVILFFIAAHFIYGYHRSAQSAALTAGFALFLFASSLLVIGDTAAIGSAARTHIALLASNHEKAMEELKSKYGVVAVTFTGEDIYDAKCSACHLFDQKKVGPPYTETIPKYQGKKADLVSYILNPVQKNTAYPPMPNQGLRPAEADSIASYILQKVTASVQKAVK